MFQTKVVEKNQNTLVLLNTFFSLENRIFYETVWKNIVEADRP